MKTLRNEILISSVTKKRHIGRHTRKKVLKSSRAGHSMYGTEVNIIYNRLVRLFYSELHAKNANGIQLSFPGFSCSNIEMIYNNIFRATVVLANQLVNEEKIPYEVVFVTFKTFYERDELGKLCNVQAALRDSFAFAKQMLVQSQIGVTDFSEIGRKDSNL